MLNRILYKLGYVQRKRYDNKCRALVEAKKELTLVTTRTLLTMHDKDQCINDLLLKIESYEKELNTERHKNLLATKLLKDLKIKGGK